MEEEPVPAPHPDQREKPLTAEGAPAEGPMTPAQASYLHSLCREAGEIFDDSLTAGEAERRIDELRAKVGRADRRG